MKGPSVSCTAAERKGAGLRGQVPLQGKGHIYLTIFAID